MLFHAIIIEKHRKGLHRYELASLRDVSPGEEDGDEWDDCAYWSWSSSQDSLSLKNIKSVDSVL